MPGKQFGLLTVVAGAMALVLAACGADPTATPTSAPTATPPPQATPTATPDAAALFQAEWDALIAAAHEEGQLSLVFGGGGANFRPLAAFFGEKFGIEMIIATGSGRAGVERTLAEQTAGRYLVDAMYGGATPVATRMIPANALDPIADLFMRPDVTDKSLWYGGRHWYTDPPQQFQFSYAADARPMNLSMVYNTDLVSQEDIDAMSSVFDYLDPKWKGKIVSHSPVSGGGRGTYYTVYVHPEIGPSWIDGFVSRELEVTFNDERRFVVDGIAKGKFHMGIAIGGSGNDLDSLSSLGVPVKRLRKEFKEGGTLSASSDTHNMTVPINRPHPNAAKLWVNWFLSQEGQTFMHTNAARVSEPTLRLDVTEWGKTEEAGRRVEGKSYYFLGTDPALVGKRQEALDYATAAYEAARGL